MLFLVTLNQSHWPGENSHANHQHKLKTLNIHSTFVSFSMLNILKICCICFTETVNSKSYASKAFLSLKMQATGMDGKGALEMLYFASFYIFVSLPNSLGCHIVFSCTHHRFLSTVLFVKKLRKLLPKRY